MFVKAILRRLANSKLRRQPAQYHTYDTENLLLPHITFTVVRRSDHTLLFKQFPGAPAFATTFNSYEGLALDRVAIDLTIHVFSHGQLYTALLRVRKRENCRVSFPPGHSGFTTLNATYPRYCVMITHNGIFCIFLEHLPTHDHV